MGEEEGALEIGEEQMEVSERKANGSECLKENQKGRHALFLLTAN